MTDKNEDGFTPDEELSADNEMLKLKLEMEHGMQMHHAEKDLPKEIENEFLKYIYDFEKMHKDAKEITIYEKIGNPCFKKIEEIKQQDIAKELEKLNTLLNKNGVNLSCLCDYDDAIIYRFITEELFEKKVDDIKIDGMVSMFTYEDYYPNQEYDLNRISTGFIDHFLLEELNEDFGFIDVYDDLIVNGKFYLKTDFYLFIQHFRDAFLEIKLEFLEIENIVFNLEDEYAKVDFSINYRVFLNHIDFIDKVDVGVFEFNRNDDYWKINKMQFPF